MPSTRFLVSAVVISATSLSLMSGLLACRLKEQGLNSGLVSDNKRAKPQLAASYRLNIRCRNDRPVGFGGIYGIALEPRKKSPFDGRTDWSLNAVDKMEEDPEILKFFDGIPTLRDANLIRPYSLTEIRELESYGLLCDLNDEKNDSWIYGRAKPIFALPMGRRLLIFGFRPGDVSIKSFNGHSVPTTDEGSYIPVGDIPLFTDGNLNELASALPYFRNGSTAAANAYADGLTFILHSVPYGTAADQLATTGNLDLPGVASIFVDTASVLTFGVFNLPGKFTHFERVALYASRASVSGGIIIHATDVYVKSLRGDAKGAQGSAVKLSYTALATVASMMRIGLGTEEIANRIARIIESGAN